MFVTRFVQIIKYFFVTRKNRNIMEINKENLIKFRKEFTEAMLPLQEKYGVVISKESTVIRGLA